MCCFADCHRLCEPCRALSWVTVRMYWVHQAGHVCCVQVKPVLALLKTTLVGSGAALLLSTVLLFSLIRTGSDADGVYGEPRRAAAAAAVPAVVPLHSVAQVLHNPLWGLIPREPVPSEVPRQEGSVDGNLNSLLDSRTPLHAFSAAMLDGQEVLVQGEADRGDRSGGTPMATSSTAPACAAWRTCGTTIRPPPRRQPLKMAGPAIVVSAKLSCCA